MILHLFGERDERKREEDRLKYGRGRERLRQRSDNWKHRNPEKHKTTGELIVETKTGYSKTQYCALPVMNLLVMCSDN